MLLSFIHFFAIELWMTLTLTVRMDQGHMYIYQSKADRRFPMYLQWQYLSYRHLRDSLRSDEVRQRRSKLCTTKWVCRFDVGNCRSEAPLRSHQRRHTILSRNNYTVTIGYDNTESLSNVDNALNEKVNSCFESHRGREKRSDQDLVSHLRGWWNQLQLNTSLTKEVSKRRSQSALAGRNAKHRTVQRIRSRVHRLIAQNGRHRLLHTHSIEKELKDEQIVWITDGETDSAFKRMSLKKDRYRFAVYLPTGSVSRLEGNKSTSAWRRVKQKLSIRVKNNKAQARSWHTAKCNRL